MTYLLFTLGLLMLFAGGEGLVRGASSVARHFNLSPMLIGLTIVGFGTSAPELLVSLQAAWEGKPEIAIGNVVGSNIANILLILGVSAAIAPLVIPAHRLWRDLAFMLAATFLFWGMLYTGQISRLFGAILFLGLLAFLWVAFKYGKIEEEEDAVDENQLKAWGFTIGGLVVLVIGARLLVDNAILIAQTFGVSEAVIGLTIVAVGTSLPELATSIVAAFRKQTEIAVGNVIGSNIFNFFSIIGITALVMPIPADIRFATIDMPVAAAVAVGLAITAIVLNGLPRIAGVLLLVAYAAYIALMA